MSTENSTAVEKVEDAKTAEATTPVAKVKNVVNPKTIRKALGAKFIMANSIADILSIGYNINHNVILWGPGGHGKSEMTELFFNTIGIEPFVQALGEGSTEDLILGGLNMKEFQESGKIYYNVENSFMNHEYVVFEELLDCPANVLLRLKDILTSGVFRNGSQQFNIKTKFIVCLTNRSREEVSEDSSIQALMERFPMEYEVKWNGYNEDAYNSLYKKVFNLDQNELLNSGLNLVSIAAVASNATLKKTISPRTMVYAGQMYQHTGNLADLKYFSGFCNAGIKEAETQIKHLEDIRADYEIIKESEKVVDYYSSKENTAKFLSKSSKEQTAILLDFEKQIKIFTHATCTDQNSVYKKKVVDKMNNVYKTLESLQERSNKMSNKTNE